MEQRGTRQPASTLAYVPLRERCLSLLCPRAELSSSRSCVLLRALAPCSGNKDRGVARTVGSGLGTTSTLLMPYGSPHGDPGTSKAAAVAMERIVLLLGCIRPDQQHRLQRNLIPKYQLF